MNYVSTLEVATTRSSATCAARQMAAIHRQDMQVTMTRMEEEHQTAHCPDLHGTLEARDEQEEIRKRAGTVVMTATQAKMRR